MEEIRQQNSQLLRTFDDLRSRQVELDRMYREVAEANRRMVEVNSQLEEKAETLERAKTCAERLRQALTTNAPIDEVRQAYQKLEGMTFAIAEALYADPGAPPA